MNTRFSPSLNGSLHLGHLWMAWVNYAWAKQENGRFVLRFDDLAPRYFDHESVARQSARYADEGLNLLERAGIVPDATTFLSAQEGDVLQFPLRSGGQNHWLRAPNLEGHANIISSPRLVAARVMADIREGVDTVIRGEDLTPEIQLYEYLNEMLGGAMRRLLLLPRLRVRVGGQITTISKTHGNLQLRDLFARESPDVWVERVRRAGMIDWNAPISLANLQIDPMIELASI